MIDYGNSDDDGNDDGVAEGIKFNTEVRTQSCTTHKHVCVSV
jgi:hypothetical protein